MRKPRAAPEDRQAGQSAGQAKGAATRRDATLAVLIAARRLTQVALGPAAGRSERTVRQHWPAILEAARSRTDKPAVQVAIDKKKSVSAAVSV